VKRAGRLDLGVSSARFLFVCRHPDKLVRSRHGWPLVIKLGNQDRVSYLPAHERRVQDLTADSVLCGTVRDWLAGNGMEDAKDGQSRVRRRHRTRARASCFPASESMPERQKKAPRAVPVHEFLFSLMVDRAYRSASALEKPGVTCHIRTSGRYASTWWETDKLLLLCSLAGDRNESTAATKSSAGTSPARCPSSCPSWIAWAAMMPA
jgi:hypothetical protein